MAVLWRSNENTGAPDARYREDGDASPAVPGAAGQKNTFLEKHLRICDPLPSEADMKNIVQKVLGDRNKNQNVPVPSVSGPSKPKKQLYGSIKPHANSIYFIGPASFEETNAWIERFVTSSNAHAEVPILGNGVVVTYHDNGTSSVVKAGKIKLSIAVGNSTDFKGERGEQLSMQSKVVYHWGGLVSP